MNFISPQTIKIYLISYFFICFCYDFNALWKMWINYINVYKSAI